MYLNENIDIEEAVTTTKMVLSGVKVCGLKSRNNREYPIHVLQEAVSLYHNQPVYLDHDTSKANRKYIERVGYISNPQIKADGLYGDLNLNPHHSLAESIWFDFSNNTKKLGISHVIDGDMAGNVITKIKDIKSVDIVNNPATVLSLREEEQNETNEVQLLKEEIEKLKSELINKDKLIKETIDTFEKRLTEVENSKSVKAVSIVPQYESPKSENITDWVNKITRKK